MDLKLGAEAGLKLQLIDGKAVLSVGYDGKGIDGAISLSADAEYFIDKVFDLIPGDSALEQMAKAVIKQAIKAAKV
jgi:hypothetical protein